MNTIAALPRSSRTAPALWLLASQAVLLLSLAAWLILAGFSFMASGPASPDGVLLPKPLLWALWAYPVLPLACSAAAWRAFRRGDARRAMRWTTIPLAGALPLLAYAWYMALPVG